MCFRPTTTVLATLNTTDFLYTCDGHLTDRGFATLIEPPPEASTAAASETKKVSDEEIRRIREEWEERQKRAKEKEKAAAGNGDDNQSKDPATKTPPPKPHPPPPSPIPVPGSSTPTKLTHQRYVLHRDVWSMRLTEHKKKRQATAVKEVAPRLPMTPRGIS